MTTRTAERMTVTVEEAAEMLGIGRSTASLAVKSGELPTIRLGRRLLVPRAQIDRMLGVNNKGASPTELPRSGL